MSTTDRRIAAFDFDGTLTRRDTLLPFLVRACGARAVARALRTVGPTALRARAGRIETDLHHRDATKEALLRALFAGRPASWFAEQGEAYARTLPRRFRPEVAAQADWHRREGHELVLVSASLGTYLRPFAAANGFDHVIAVELEADDAGLLTGALVGPNVRAAEKAVRLRAWLDGDEPAVLWAYGNSSGDTELLAMADAPTWVAGPNADRRYR